MIGRALARKSLGGGYNLVDPNDVPWSLQPQPWWLTGGQPFGLERAVGLPALLGVLLRVGQGCGMMPRKVYSVAADGSHEVAADSDAYELLHDRPSAEASPFAFNADLGTSLAGSGKAIARKIKSVSGRGVLELIVEDAQAWKARRSGGELVFDRVKDGGQTTPLTQSDLIYIRGIALSGQVEPLSPIAAHRVGITLGLKRQRFELSHLDNGAQPGTVLVAPPELSQKQAQEWVDKWDEAHRGAERAFQTAAIGGGFQVTTLPVSLQDQQYVEANRMTAEQIGAVYALPKSFLNVGDQAPTDADWRFWVTFGLGWITAACDQAFSADRDLFPASSGLFAETVTDALLKPDIRTRYEAYKAARQAGWMTSNEIRRLENLPAHPDGDILQVIPVGGGEPSQDAKAAASTHLEEWLETVASADERPILRNVLARVQANGSQ